MNTNTLDAIKVHGLSVRQIPLQVVHLYSMSHRPGTDTVRHKLPDMTPARFAFHVKQHSTSPDFVLDHAAQEVWRVYTREVTIPANAGCWMCQQVTWTSSRVEWSTKRDNLTPTLEESVGLFLSRLPVGV